MSSTTCTIISWNVRGLNAPAKQEAIHETTTAHRTAILMLQETKIDVWSSEIAREVGGQLLQGCVVLPALGTRGGAAFFWNKDIVTIDSHSIGGFTIMAKVTELSPNAQY